MAYTAKYPHAPPQRFMYLTEEQKVGGVKKKKKEEEKIDLKVVFIAYSHDGP